MPKATLAKKRVLPETFNQYNQAQYQRVVQLTQQAITKLESEHKPVTLMAIVETARELDTKGTGISSPKTILRNPEATELFRQHSQTYQARQQKTKKTKRKRTKTNGDVRATYQGLHSSDLIQMVEDLKKQNAELKAKLGKCQAERDEAYRVRDETLQHNARQLALLTAKAQLPDKKR